MKVFEAETADQAWRMAAREFRDTNSFRVHSGRGGQTSELLHASFVIRDPTQRWVGSRCPALNPAFAIVEVIWILRGRKDSSFVNYWNPQLPKFAGTGCEYHGAYGYRLRRYFGIDQLGRAFSALQRNPKGRQVVLQIWDPKVDFPGRRGQPVAEDIPCNVCALLKVREGRLEWTQILRSNDLFRGVPYNFFQFTFLQELLAGWLQVELGTYIHLSDSLHVYKRDERFVRAFQARRGKRNADLLCFPRKESERVLKEMERRVMQMAKPNLKESNMRDLAEARGLPTSYANMLAVVCADGARRRGWFDLAHQVMAGCTNPALRQVWDRWFERTLRSGKIHQADQSP